MARIRTLPKAVKEIKEKDPNSYINVPLLRRLVKQGVIKTIQTGGKHALIDLDNLEDFLVGGSYEDR